MNGFKTYLGIALAFLGGVAGHLDVNPADLPEWADTLTLMVGSGLAAFGRWHKERRAPE